MWKILRAEDSIKAAVFMMLVTFAATAQAQETSTIINQNTVGFNLPGVTLPQGHDEVRAADGTTCRSAISGTGAYMDFGVIGNPEDNGTSSLSSYGRVVIPLGRKAKRLDCSRLYDLEVQRLEMELRLMQMGLNRGVTPPSGTSTGGMDYSEGVPTTNGGDEIEVSQAANESTAEQQLASNDMKTSGDWDDEGWTTIGRKEARKKIE